MERCSLYVELGVLSTNFTQKKPYDARSAWKHACRPCYHQPNPGECVECCWQRKKLFQNVPPHPPSRWAAIFWPPRLLPPPPVESG